MNKPQMPRPHHGTRGVLDGDNSIAVLNFVLGYAEANESVRSSVCDAEATCLYDATLVGPYDAGLGGRIGSILHIDVRRADVLTGVVLEMLKDVSTTVRGLISMTVGYTVLDGITIDQRDAIVARSRDEITVGTFFYIHQRTISTGIGQVVGIGSCAFGRSTLEHLVVSGKFINNSGRFHCGVACFCCCATITLIGEVAEPSGFGCTFINPAIGSVVPFLIFGNLPRNGLRGSAIGCLTIALHLELCTSQSVASIVEGFAVVGEG